MANPVKDFPVQKEPFFLKNVGFLVPTSQGGGRWKGVIYAILFHRKKPGEVKDVTGADWLVQTVLLEQKIKTR